MFTRHLTGDCYTEQNPYPLPRVLSIVNLYVIGKYRIPGSVKSREKLLAQSGTMKRETLYRILSTTELPRGECTLVVSCSPHSL